MTVPGWPGSMHRLVGVDDEPGIDRGQLQFGSETLQPGGDLVRQEPDFDGGVRATDDPVAEGSSQVSFFKDHLGVWVLPVEDDRFGEQRLGDDHGPVYIPLGDLRLDVDHPSVDRLAVFS